MTTPPPGREETLALVVAKAPQPGRVKTRLASTIGSHLAAELAHAMLLDTVDACRTEIGPTGLLCADHDDVQHLRELAGSMTPIVVQEPGDLGAALRTGVRAGCQLAHAVLLVSADIPGPPPNALRAAAAHLRDGADVVVGPGEDGGYWLIGVRQDHPGLFDRIPWSTGDVLAATLEQCRLLSLDARLVDRWRDLDTLADLELLVERRSTLPGRRTAAWLDELHPFSVTEPDTTPTTPTQEVLPR
jgi:rSAM/selenodomain-associated transferase 1